MVDLSVSMTTYARDHNLGKTAHKTTNPLTNLISISYPSNCPGQIYTITIGELSWKKVVTSDGIEIGQLQGGEISQQNWKITHFHIGLNDDTTKKLGLSKPYMGRILICLPVSYIQSVTDVVTLNKSFEELKTSKECQEFSVT